MQYSCNQAVPAKTSQEEKNILIVEDDHSIGAMLVEAFTQETSYNPVLVNGALEALETVLAVKPCLFITDYRLPYMNGIELYDMLCRTGKLTDTPAIVISSFLPEEEVKKRHLVGFQKPFDLDQLLYTVDQLLQ